MRRLPPRSPAAGRASSVPPDPSPRSRPLLPPRCRPPPQVATDRVGVQWRDDVFACSVLEVDEGGTRVKVQYEPPYQSYAPEWKPLSDIVEASAAGGPAVPPATATATATATDADAAPRVVALRDVALRVMRRVMRRVMQRVRCSAACLASLGVS